MAKQTLEADEQTDEQTMISLYDLIFSGFKFNFLHLPLVIMEKVLNQLQVEWQTIPLFCLLFGRISAFLFESYTLCVCSICVTRRGRFRTKQPFVLVPFVHR